VNPIGLRIGAVLRKAGIVEPIASTKDKPGREQILYDYLKGRVCVGKVYNDLTRNTEPMLAAKLQISDACQNLIRTIPGAPRDEKNSEEIAEFLGDDALQSSGYGLYAMFGKPNRKPLPLRVEERFQQIQRDEPQVTITELMAARARIQAEEQARIPRPVRMKRRWRFQSV
jgi:hypothetical protein